jgi:hypothetical protein
VENIGREISHAKIFQVKEITEFNYLTGAILKDKKMKICPRHSFAEGYARTFSIAGETCARFLNILKAEIFIFLEKKLFFLVAKR